MINFSLLRQKQIGFSNFLFKIFNVKKQFAMPLALLVAFCVSSQAVAGKESNPYYYREYYNRIVEDLWFGELPAPERFIGFLEVLSGKTPDIEGLKDGSLTDILEYYRKRLQTRYQRLDPVETMRLSVNIDRFIDNLTDLLPHYSFDYEVISKALFYISQATFIT
jgi:hypothetical protein